MTEEAPNHSFREYAAARQSLATYGDWEQIEEDQLITKASSNSTFQLPKLLLADTTNPQARVVSIIYTGGAGKTWAFRNLIKGAVASITSGNRESLFSVIQSAGMASEPPVIAEEQSVDEIIRRIRTTLPDRYGQKLSARINELQQAVKDEELDGRGIDAGSLSHFVGVLKAYPAFRCPTVSVTPDRNIYASWKSGKDRVFSVHFLPNGSVRFVIFYPNTEHPGDVIRVSGVATADVVVKVAVPHGILSWATE